LKSEHRLPYLKPEGLDEEQRKLYDHHVEVMQSMPYPWMTADGELNGPSNAMMHYAEIGNMLFPMNRALVRDSVAGLGWPVHELAILTVLVSAGARFGIYAHTRLARKHGLSDAKIAAVVAGRRPPDLSIQEAIAYDLAASLCKAGPVPETIYRRAVEAFGQETLLALVFVVGNFKMIGTILNAFDEPLPAEDA
jgi:4-carboxymuconolactone decarboxylase